MIQLNGLLQSALTELGHKVIEFGWDKDPNHGKSPLCLPYDEYMKPITTSEEEAGYDPEVDDPDWDNYPFKWGGVVPEAWALEFIAKYLKEHNPNGSGAPAPAPSPAPAAAEAPAPAAPSEAPALPREVLPLLNEPDYVDTQKRVLGAMPSEIPGDTTGEIEDSDLVAPGLALLQQRRCHGHGSLAGVRRQRRDPSLYPSPPRRLNMEDSESGHANCPTREAPEKRMDDGRVAPLGCAAHRRVTVIVRAGKVGDRSRYLAEVEQSRCTPRRKPGAADVVFSELLL